MSEWVEKTLGEICDEVNGIIKTGPFGSQLHQSDYSEWGIPVVMPKNIIDDKISTDDIAYISEETAERLSHHRMQPGDIVYGRRGDIGRQSLITEIEDGWLCGTGCLRISLGETVILPLFLHYYLMQSDVIDWIYKQAIGATMPNLNTTILRSVPILYPPLPIQRRIAAILSAYDDLIENNIRRIKSLEQAAHDLYREWFVEFRFPGHEEVPMKDSDTEYGMIPKGWEVKCLGDIAHDKRNNVQPSAIEPDTPYVGLEHIPRKTIALSDWGMAGEVNSTKLVFEVGDILFAKIRPYLHKVAVAPVDGVSSSDAIIIVPKSLEFYSLVLMCVSDEHFVDYATTTSQGTQMPRANWNVLAEYPVVIPPKELLGEFNEFVSDIVNDIRTNIFRNTTLRETRDLLLPRLVSGQVDVSEIELGDLS